MTLLASKPATRFPIGRKKPKQLLNRAMRSTPGSAGGTFSIGNLQESSGLKDVQRGTPFAQIPMFLWTRNRPFVARPHKSITNSISCQDIFAAQLKILERQSLIASGIRIVGLSIELQIQIRNPHSAIRNPSCGLDRSKFPRQY